MPTELSPAPQVLVTGGSGFIGSHLCRYLVAEGWSVVSLDTRNPHPAFFDGSWQHVEIDLTHEADLRAALTEISPTLIFHLAARTDLGGRSIADYRANTEGVRGLARAVAATPSVKRVICTSSQLVCRIGYEPSHELDYAPSTAYGESKVETETIWRQSDGGGREWVIVRPTTIWGPYMNAHYLRFFRLLVAGLYVHIGTEQVLKSYGFVGNIVRQYVRLAEAPATAVNRGTFYLADYTPISLNSWAERFRIALGAPRIRRVPAWVTGALAFIGDGMQMAGWKGFPFTSFRLGNVTTPSVVDMAPTRAICGELPYSVDDGVQLTADWLRDALQLVQPPRTARRL